MTKKMIFFSIKIGAFFWCGQVRCGRCGAGAGAVMMAAALKALAVVGVIQLAWNLRKAVYEVNRHGGEPDTTEWEQRK